MKVLPCYSTPRPKVSVITATYNREKHLSTCIESVMAQSFKNWEHIIVDDGSEDETHDLVRSYMKKDNRIRYTNHSNRRQSLSLNVGLMMAVGDYICILDSDDHYLPNHIESRLQYFEENPGVDFVYGGMKVVGNAYVPDADNPGRLIHFDECSGTCSFFGLAITYKMVGGFTDVVLGNDKDMLEKITAFPFSVKRMTEGRYRTVVYVRTEDSVTSQYEREFQSTREKEERKGLREERDEEKGISPMSG